MSLKRHTATTSTWTAGRKVASSTSSKHNCVFILAIKNKKQRLPLTNTAQTDQGLLSGWTQLLGSTEVLLATVRYRTCPRYGDRGQWSNTLVGMWRTPLEKWNVRTRHFCYSIMSRVAKTRVSFDDGACEISHRLNFVLHRTEKPSVPGRDNRSTISTHPPTMHVHSFTSYTWNKRPLGQESYSQLSRLQQVCPKCWGLRWKMTLSGSILTSK